jgi:malonyl-CoA O-methyltransferase
MSTSTLHLSPGDAHALWASSYDENPNPVLALEERTLEPLLPSLKGCDVLDVACGTGRWLMHLVRGGASTAAGLDISPAMLRQSARKPGLAGQLIEADALAMPIRTGFADFVICSFGLSYIPDVSLFAKELSRVVKNGGLVVLSDLHPAAHTRGWKRSFRHNGTVVEISSFSRSIPRIRQAFEEQGFVSPVVVEANFGEAEKPIFEKAGKGDLWEEMGGEPAIYACMFRRSEGKGDGVLNPQTLGGQY